MFKRKGYIVTFFIMVFVLIGCSERISEDSNYEGKDQNVVEITGEDVLTPDAVEKSEDVGQSETDEVSEDVTLLETIEVSEDVTLLETIEDETEVIYLPVDMGDSIGVVIEVSELPDDLRELKTMYPSGLIEGLSVSFYNTETKEKRHVDLFLKEEGEDNYVYPQKKSNEVFAGYFFTMITMDDKETVDAYYSSLNPDEYVNHIRKELYPVYRSENEYGFDNEFALTKINHADDYPRTTSKRDSDFKELGYITYISGGNEWIPKN